MVTVAISEVDVAVEPGADNSIEPFYPAVQLGETIVQGRVCYEASDGKAMKARANASGTSKVKYITLGKGVLNSWPEMAVPGMLVNLGAGTLIAGIAYFVDDTVAGDIVPFGDLAGGAQLSFVGIAVTTALLLFLPGYEGQTV